MYACLGVTCHLHFWQNYWGLLRATREWNGHWIRLSTQSWLWRRKFSRRSCRNSNSQPFDHEFGALNNKLSRKPLKNKNSREKPVEWPPCLAHKLKAQQHSEKLVDYEQNVRNKYIIKRRRSIPRLLVEGWLNSSICILSFRTLWCCSSMWASSIAYQERAVCSELTSCLLFAFENIWILFPCVAGLHAVSKEEDAAQELITSSVCECFGAGLLSRAYLSRADFFFCLFLACRTFRSCSSRWLPCVLYRRRGCYWSRGL